MEPLASAGVVTDKPALLEKLLLRESMATTAIGGGVAIPHARNPEELEAPAPILVVGLCDKGADYQAPDGGPVHLFFLVYTESVIVHLRTIARLSSIFGKHEAVRQLRSASTPKEALHTLLKLESAL